MTSSSILDYSEAFDFTNSELFNALEKLPDPRVGWTLRHNFIDIVVIAILAVLSGADTWNDIEEYGESKHEWLKGFLMLPNGIPSHDTFNNVIRCIEPNQFASCFQDWITAAITMIGAEVIPIDGKTHRGSYDRRKKQKPLHTVSAWASSHQILLGQTKVDKKSNEITAIPELLKTISVENCIVTIDAMGCQQAIADQIVAKNGDYILAVKGNQKNLLNAIEQAFVEVLGGGEEIRYEYCESTEEGHDRIETRRCWLIPAAYISSAWTNTQTLIMIESERMYRNKISKVNKYYISSLPSNVRKVIGAVRSHWSVENQLHWYLDVVFGEDSSRIRKDNGAENFGTLRRLALGLLKRETSLKKSIRLKRYRASMNNDYLMKVLLA
jgi:predicted transposase YbfD/YdcC